MSKSFAKPIISTPDDSGWYFFRKNKRSALVVAYVSEDGVAYCMDENGKTWELEDFIGEWEEIEPQNI